MVTHEVKDFHLVVVSAAIKYCLGTVIDGDNKTADDLLQPVIEEDTYPINHGKVPVIDGVCDESGGN